MAKVAEEIDVQLTNLQQLCDAIMSMWTKISEECFPAHLLIYAAKNYSSSEAKTRC